MLSTNAKIADTFGATIEKPNALASEAGLGGVFRIKCHGKDGNLKWEDAAHNLVVNEGLKDLNDKYFSGSAYTATWYLGLVNASPTPSYAAGDTLASHAGWDETTDYSGNRKAVTFGAATLAGPSVIDNSGAPSLFAMTSTVTVAGAFLASVDTGTSGILFSVSNFEAPGNREVVSGDTLSVTYEFSANAA